MKKFIFVPLLLALTVMFTAFGGHDDCPPDGKPNPKKGKKAELKPREKLLNRRKNRDTSPQPSDFDGGVTIQKMYDSKDDSIFDENKAAEIDGYIFRAADAGMETCNCFTEDKSRYNTNVYISPTPPTKTTRTADCIVAVITPYSRTLSNAKDWTADKINDKWVGKHVKISGWLIYDYAKGNLSIETNPNSAEPERRTVWGICPMTDMKEVK